MAQAPRRGPTHGLSQNRVGALLTVWDAYGSYRSMKPERATALFIALALCVIRAPGNPARAQNGSAEYSRQSDVIYGRKFGLALTMEVFTAAKPNGLGVVWVVSSSGKSSREQTLQPSFERRISPLLTRGYTRSLLRSSTEARRGSKCQTSWTTPRDPVCLAIVPASSVLTASASPSPAPPLAD